MQDVLFYSPGTQGMWGTCHPPQIFVMVMKISISYPQIFKILNENLFWVLIPVTPLYLYSFSFCRINPEICIRF